MNIFLFHDAIPKNRSQGGFVRFYEIRKKIFFENSVRNIVILLTKVYRLIIAFGFSLLQSLLFLWVNIREHFTTYTYPYLH